MLLLSLALQLAAGDTLKLRSIEHPPPADLPLDSVSLGSPQLRIPTGQGTARVWLVRARDTVFIAAIIPDSTPYWGDDFVLSLDTRGDAAPAPEHDDFQLYFRRSLDSSVVFRGRKGRWEPPRDDPDWRIGPDRSGGGWEVSVGDNLLGWNLLLRLDRAWFAGEPGRLSRVAFRIYDNDPSGWFAWPPPPESAPHSSVERSPSLWVPVR